MRPDTVNLHARSNTGFTLVEVLISISLLAVALTLLMGGFRFTSKAWDAGERVTEQTAELERVHRIFGNMLDRLLPLSLQPAGEEGYAFSGSSNRLRFAAQLPPYPVSGGIFTLEFAVTSDKDLDRLELKIAPFTPETFREGELKTDQKSLLFETTGRLSFSYFSRAVSEEWQSDWPDLEVPPQLVRLQLRETVQPWPEIVAPISIDMDHACVFPDLGGACRL